LHNFFSDLLKPHDLAKIVSKMHNFNEFFIFSPKTMNHTPWEQGNPSGKMQEVGGSLYALSPGPHEGL